MTVYEEMVEKIKRMTLEDILNEEREHRRETGQFGIIACKISIQWEVEYEKKTLFQLLEEYYNRATSDPFFNNTMVLACWEMINGERN